ncbi:MAG TPA: hypothetical protein DEF45_22060 [Rhodopirellula sp.]|nr:hypothetical protein [Rhodopirellula sp.]
MSGDVPIQFGTEELGRSAIWELCKSGDGRCNIAFIPKENANASLFGGATHQKEPRSLSKANVVLLSCKT